MNDPRFIFCCGFYLFLSLRDSAPSPDKSVRLNKFKLPNTVLKYIDRVIDDVEKPPNDGREYLGLILKNRMEVILVSDPDSAEAAAALHVEAGSMDDPLEFQGLAHLFEHVSFLGTNKYPADKDEFRDFVKYHGGVENAMTSLEYALYFFKIQASYFPEAIDRFAEICISPLLRQVSIEREVSAVNSEYLEGLSADGEKIAEVINNLDDPDHRFFKFLCGNEQSLLESSRSSNVSLSDEMRKFFTKFYTANRMKLAVLSRESVHELAELIVPIFANVPEGTVPQERPSFANQSQTGYEIKYVPIKDERSLVVYFPMPDLLAQYNGLPTAYILKFFANDGHGSFAFWLKNKNLSSEMEASYDSSRRINSGRFVIWIDLTEYGLQNTDVILWSLFAYLNFIKSQPIQKWIQNEINVKRRLEFFAQDKTGVLDLVLDLSSGMSSYGIKKAISGPYEEKFDFDEKPFKDALDLLNPKNFNYIIVSKNFSGQTNRIGKWYKAEYSVNKIPSDTLLKLEKADFGALPIEPPKPNEFLPSNITLPSCNASLLDSELSYPKIVYEDEKKRLWFSEAGYDRPETEANFIIKVPIISETRLVLFVQIITQIIAEKMSDAIEAGYILKMKIDRSSIVLTLAGFSVNFPIFLEKVFHILINCEIDDKTFSNARSRLIKEIKGTLVADSTTAAMRYRNRILTVPSEWIDKLPEMQETTIEDIQWLKSKIFSSISLEAFVFGDIDRETALKLFNNAADIIESRSAARPLNRSDIQIARIVQLPYNSHFLYEKKSLIHPQSAVVVNFQADFGNMKDDLVSRLLGYIFDNKCYEQFRTKEKLGYTAQCTWHTSLSVVNFFFLIEGNYSDSFLTERIDAFVSGMKTEIGKISQKEFASFKETLIEKYGRKSINFKEMMFNYWKEIEIGEYFFARKKKYVEYLKNITIEDLFEFVERVMDENSPRRKKLVVHIHGVSHVPKINQSPPQNKKTGLRHGNKWQWPTMIRDIEDFKKSMPLYPTVKPQLSLKFLK